MIEFQNVTKRFGTQTVLDAITLQINAGERIGITGPNGAGKTTIFELITGEIAPDHGNVTTPRDLRIGHLRQQLDSAASDTGLLDYTENAVPEVRAIERDLHALEHRLESLPDTERQAAIQRLGTLQTRYEHLGGYALRHEAEAALSGLGFREPQFAAPLRTFSGGWQMRAELCRCLIAHPDILLLDEPSNYLDIPAVEWLQRYLKEFRGTLVLISHDRYLLNSLTTVTLEVAGGRIERYAGNYAQYVQLRVRREEQREGEYANTTRKREKAERFIERFRAKATKAAQVKSRVKMLERMDVPDTPTRLRAAPRLRIADPPRSGAEVVRLEDAAARYGTGDFILRHINLSIEQGEKIALVGLNGMGKTTLLRLLTGKLAPAEGRRVLGHNVIPGYQSQEFTDTIAPHATVFETIKQTGASLSEQAVRSLLGGFGFSGEAVNKPVGVLSGGEKVRLAFARLLAVPPNFLALDEPTTHLDIAGREALEEALARFRGTLCVVSHDIAFVRRVATSIIAMAPPGIRRYAGGYDYYREKCAEQAAAGGLPAKVGAQTAGTAGPPDAGAKSAKERRRERAQQRAEQAANARALRKSVRRAEQQLAVFEQEQAALLEQLAADAPGTDYAGLNRRLGVIQNEIGRYTALWENAALELEQLESPACLEK